MFEGILILLKVASLGANWLHERSHFKAGQKDQLLKATQDVLDAAGIAREVRQEVEEMTDDELDQELMS